MTARGRIGDLRLMVACLQAFARRLRALPFAASVVECQSASHPATQLVHILNESEH
jgi:hypothetical protein